MVGFLLRAAITALGLWVASQLLDGLHFTSTAKLAIAAVLLGVVNAFVRPIAFILTLPITVVTLGLFLLVLNAAMIGLVALDRAGLHDLRFLDGRRRRDHREPGVLGGVDASSVTSGPHRELIRRATLHAAGRSREPIRIRTPTAPAVDRRQAIRVGSVTSATPARITSMPTICGGASDSPSTTQPSTVAIAGFT